MKDTLGGKGSGLAEMTNAGLPVPPGFTISTGACNLYYDNGGKLTPAIETEIERHIARLEKSAKATLGSSTNPLLVSVRSGAKFSMPGHDGHDPQPRPERSGGRGAEDAHRQRPLRLRQLPPLHPDVRLGGARDSEGAFEHEFEAVKTRASAPRSTPISTRRRCATSSTRFKGVVKDKTGKPFPQDPHDQLRMARNAVFRSWNNPRAKEYRRIYDIPDAIGTAVNVQMMVFGNTGDRSATGVGFTRNPATGAKEFYGEFLVNAQGEDVVAGIRTPRPIAELDRGDAEGLRAAAPDHDAAREALQGHPGLRVHDPGRPAVHAADAQRQAHRLRRGGHRHRPDEGEAGHAEGGAAAGRSGGARRSCSRRASIRRSGSSIPVATKGLPASPGAACGQVVFTADHAVEWTNQGKHVILVRRETVPDDIHGMWVSQGILTATGGMTSHAAVVGRQMGKPSIVGAGELAIDEHGRSFTVEGPDGAGKATGWRSTG